LPLPGDCQGNLAFTWICVHPSVEASSSDFCLQNKLRHM
jgi:hypothetical protein